MANMLAKLGDLQISNRSFNTRDTYAAGAMTRGFKIAPSGHGYYDAFKNPPSSAVVSQAVGPCTTVQGKTSITLFNQNDSDVGNGFMVMFNAGGGQGNAGIKLSKKADGNLTTVFINHPTMMPTSAGGNVDPGTDPSVFSGAAFIPLRQSVRIRNVTEAMGVGGVVRVARFSAGFEFPQNNVEYDELADCIRSAVNTRTYGGGELVTCAQMNAHVADAVKCNTFESAVMNVQRTDVTSDVRHNVFQAMENPSMSTLVFLIEDFTSSSGQMYSLSALSPTSPMTRSNTYEFTVCTQKAYRFKPGSLLHSMGKDMKADKNRLDSAHQHEAAKGSNLSKVVEGFKDAAGHPLTQALAKQFLASKMGGG